MFKLALIVFRESLEISLLLAIILAVTKPVANSRFFVVLGATIGVVLSAFVAISAGFVTSYFSNLGDEILDATIVLLTALIINWTVIWMQDYGYKVKIQFKHLAEKQMNSLASNLTIVMVVASTILREGAEIILFIYSIVSVGKLAVTDYLIGLGTGISLGFLSGIIIYRGLIRYAGKYIFKISTILLIFVAAGLASEAAAILTSCGLVEFGSTSLWDSSWLIDNNSVGGKILKIMLGYDATPNLLQMIFYSASLILTLILLKVKSYRKHQIQSS